MDSELNGRKQIGQLLELEEFRIPAYENVKHYKERAKRCHNKHIISRVFEPHQKVLLYNCILRLLLGKLIQMERTI